jgi:hypothetical protein
MGQSKDYGISILSRTRLEPDIIKSLLEPLQVERVSIRRREDGMFSLPEQYGPLIRATVPV